MEIDIYTENIKEGLASIYTTNDVFYNPVQEFNRDMSIAALRVFINEYYDSQKKPKVAVKRKCDDSLNSCESSTLVTENSPLTGGVTVVEALSATGLRSIRYALEVPGIKQIYANDCSDKAVESIKYNIQKNKVEHLVTPTNNDAVWLMQKLSFENNYVEVIDLDPYGCPTRFLDSAINCIRNGGLLMVTCTDMAVTAGNTPETCFVKYGAVSLRSSACHEMSIRIALQCIASCCGRYGKYIIPLLSFSVDFYIRVFVMVKYSQQNCKKVSSNMSMVYQCCGCGMFTLQPLGNTIEKDNGNCAFSLPVGPPVSTLCVHCKHKHKLGGPIWSGKIHDEKFIEKMLLLAAEPEKFQTSTRMEGLLSLIKEELHEVPLFHTVDSICGRLHCEMIPLRLFRSALLNAGYRVSLSHCKAVTVKTNAPNSVLMDIMRCWIRDHPVSEKRMRDSDVVTEILKQPPTFIANFSPCSDAVPLSSRCGLVRFPVNPAPNWGPGTRSKSNALMDGNESKKKRNQNKHAHKKAALSEPTEIETTPRDEDDKNVSLAKCA